MKINKSKNESMRFTERTAQMQNLRSFLVMLLLLAAATGIGYIFRYAGFPETNIVIVYILSVLITAMFTQTYMLDIIASLTATFTFNFFFTQPYFSFTVYDLSYIVTFSIMTITALITSTLTSRVKKSAMEARRNEAEASALYKLINRLTDASDTDSIAYIAVYTISDVLGCNAACLFFDESGTPENTYLQQTQSGKPERRYLTDTDEIKKRIESLHTAYDVNDDFYDFPIYGKDFTLGIIRIPARRARQLDEQQIQVLHSMIENIALATDRLYIAREQLRAREETERERYRSNLLRAISHDLRTPLAGILGLSKILKDIAGDNDAVIQIAGDIFDEADWLHALVENILNLTRIQDGKLLPKKVPEAVEEVIGFAVESISRRYPQIEISVSTPDELLVVPMDARLISQVLINLLDNAVKSTKQQGNRKYTSCDGISVTVAKEKGSVYFTVSDEGTGIKEEDLPNIFTSFYTADHIRPDSRQGIGLGLTICKAIVNAHGGNITAENKEDGPGARFMFTLPMEVETYGTEK